MKRLVFLLTMVPRYGINDTIQRDTLVYILMSIFKFCSFHKVDITDYYNSPLFIVHFYNLKSITLIKKNNHNKTALTVSPRRLSVD